MTSNYFTIPLVVYPFQIIVSINETDDQLWKKLNKLGVDAEEFTKCVFADEASVGSAILFPNSIGLIRLRAKPTSPATKGCLAHEIFHIVVFVMNEVGMTLSTESDEAYAYLTGYLTTEIYKKL